MNFQPARVARLSQKGKKKENQNKQRKQKGRGVCVYACV